MRRWIGRALLALVLGLALFGTIKREEIARLMAVQTLFDADRIVDNFTHMDRLFHAVEMGSVGLPSRLPDAPRQMETPAGLDAWMAARHTTGIVVLHKGEVVFEDYRLGTAQEDRRISWSVAKSFLATLFGTAIERGEVASLDDPVTAYAPALAGSAYDGATIRDVMHMASGVEFDEDYLDFWSDINKMGRVIALGGSLDAFAASQDATIAPPGTDWHYVSIDTHVIGMVLRGATGRDVPSLMWERILAPLGLETRPEYLTDGTGTAFVLGGLNMATRDYARFGQMILQGGSWQGARIVPEAWVAEMTAPSAPTDAGDQSDYGLQWWIPHGADGNEVFAIGVYGQYIWIDRAHEVVIAVNAADRAFTEPGVFDGNIEVLRTLSAAAAAQPFGPITGPLVGGDQ